MKLLPKTCRDAAAALLCAGTLLPCEYQQLIEGNDSDLLIIFNMVVLTIPTISAVAQSSCSSQTTLQERLSQHGGSVFWGGERTYS